MNYIEVKAALATSVKEKLDGIEGDAFLDSIEWDISNTFPRKGLPEVRDTKRCKFRARVVVSGPMSDPTLGEFVSPHTTKPRFMLTIYCRDKRGSDYLGSVLKDVLDRFYLTRVDAIDFDVYDKALDCHQAKIMVSVLMGSLTYQGESICQPQSQNPQNICDYLDPDLTSVHP